MGIEAIGSVLKRNRSKEMGGKKKDWVEKCMYLEMEGVRTKRTRLEMVKNDMKGLGLASTDALDRRSWKRKIVVLIQVCV